MAAWRDNATVTVEIAFADNPLTAIASCTWVDVTNYVRDWSTKRGRSSELSNYSPGTAQVTLDNRSRLFDPSNTAGTYYGQLLPMKRLRIRASSGATSATLFCGYILGWPIDYPDFIDSTVTLGCVDAFRPLAQYAQPVTAYDAEVAADSPHAYWQLASVDDSGSSPATTGNIDVTDFYWGNPGVFAPAELAITRPVGADLAIANGSWVASGVPTVAPKTIEGWCWNFRQGNLGSTSVMRAALDATNWIRITVDASGYLSVGYSNSTDVKSYALASTGFQLTGSAHHLVLTASTTTLTLYVNGLEQWSGSLTAATSSVTFTPAAPSVVAVCQPAVGATITPAVYGLAVYTSNLAAGTVADHYQAGLTGYGHPYGDRAGARIGRILDAIGWPAADRDLSTGSTVLGPWLGTGSPLSVCQAAADADQGLFFIGGDGKIVFRDRQWLMTNSSAITAQATLGDSGSETPYYDIEIDGNHVDWIRNAVTVTYDGGTVTVKDSTSITAYGEQDDSVNAAQIPTFGGYVARQLAAYRLRLRKDAKTRIPAIKVKPRTATSTHLPTMLGLELGERVTVKRRPTGGTGTFSQDCTIQGISHRVSSDNWIVQLYLAPTTPSYTDGPYLTLGDATYGKIGTVAGNKIPY
jgi:hypothetical protein